MNRMKEFIEWQLFGVCTAIGDRLGNCHFPYPHLVYLYFFSHDGFAADRLFYPCFLDEYQTLYHGCET